MAIKYVNNFSTTLNGSITNSATSITVTDGSGLGTIGSDYVICTIDDYAGNREIIHVTARSTNTLTVTRAQEGTTGTAFASGTVIEARLTKGCMDDKASTADVPTASKFEFISSQTASSSSALNFTGLGNYSQITFVINDLKPATDNVRLYMRTSTDNGSTYDSSAGNYSYVFQGGTTGGSDLATTGSSSATEIHLCTGVGNDTNEAANGTVILYNPTSAAYKMIASDIVSIGATGVLSRCEGGGMRISAADVDAVRFLFASGNIASGTIYAYGLKKS